MHKLIQLPMSSHLGVFSSHKLASFSFNLDSAPSTMSHCRWRSSKAFVILVVCISVFTDIFLYGLIVPVLPFTLATRVGLPDAEIQRWTSILLACYGGSILLGSCTSAQNSDIQRDSIASD